MSAELAPWRFAVHRRERVLHEAVCFVGGAGSWLQSAPKQTLRPSDRAAFVVPDLCTLPCRHLIRCTCHRKFIASVC